MRVSTGALLLLCVAFSLLGLVQAARDAPTVDEAVDLTAGVVAVELRDLRMNPEHGLLHHVLPGLSAVVLADPVVPRTPAFEAGDWFDYTDDFISANDHAGRLDEILFWFRVVPLMAAVVTGVLLYRIATRLTTRLGGLIAAFIWLGTPYVLGLAHLSSLDVTFTLAAVSFAYALERLARHADTGRVIVLALTLGGALLVRHSAVVLVPVAAVAVAVTLRGQSRSQVLRSLALVALIPIGVVWTVHRSVDPTPVSGEARERFDGMIATASSAGPAEELALSVPMPVEWKAGFAYLALTSEERPSHALGRSFQGQPLWYLPANALVKLPMTVTFAIVAGAVGWWSGRRRLRGMPVMMVALTGCVLAMFVLLQPLALGLRLGVPLLPFAALIAAGAAFLPRIISAPALVLLFAGQAAALVVSHPASLAWTPPPFGDGFRFVSDSSIDFGQANRAVRDVHQVEPFAAHALLAPRGYDALPGVPPLVNADLAELRGRVAVSSTALSILAREDLAWLRAYCPVDVIEDAVLVYEFDEPPDTSPGPSLPERPCDGGPSRRAPSENRDG